MKPHFLLVFGELYSVTTYSCSGTWKDGLRGGLRGGRSEDVCSGERGGGFLEETADGATAAQWE